jgi:putative endonuclease
MLAHGWNRVNLHWSVKTADFEGYRLAQDRTMGWMASLAADIEVLVRTQLMMPQPDRETKAGWLPAGQPRADSHRSGQRSPTLIEMMQKVASLNATKGSSQEPSGRFRPFRIEWIDGWEGMMADKKPQQQASSEAGPEQRGKKDWYLYLLHCADGTTYTGITTDPYRRVKEHNAGRAARYTSQERRRPVRLLGVWRFSGRASATRAEVRLKKRPAARKRQLAARQLSFEHAPFCPEYVKRG